MNPNSEYTNILGLDELLSSDTSNNMTFSQLDVLLGGLLKGIDISDLIKPSVEESADVDYNLEDEIREIIESRASRIK